MSVIVNCALYLLVTWWCSGSVLNYCSQGLRFDSSPVHCQITTLSKLFTQSNCREGYDDDDDEG